MPHFWKSHVAAHFLLEQIPCTTYCALVNGLALHLKYPECKKKIRAEIDLIMGPSCIPRLRDRQYMPYTYAFCTKSTSKYLRGTTGCTTHVPERCGYEVYSIKKGFVVFSNLWCIHHDEKLRENTFTVGLKLASQR